MNRFTKTILMIALAAGSLSPAMASAVVFNDSFEGPVINPFWAMTQDYGTISLSAEQARTGTQSLKFTSSSGGQRGMYLAHTFTEPMKGRVSAWFYDSSPGSETLYQFLTIGGWGGARVGVDDYESLCYKAYAYGTGATGFGCAYNNYPGSGNTIIGRSLGWHHLEINVAANEVTLLIDGTIVLQRTGDYTLDFVTLEMTGPFWRPNTVSYWDDVSIDVYAAIPEPGYLGTVGLTLIGFALALSRKRRRGSSAGL